MMRTFTIERDRFWVSVVGILSLFLSISFPPLAQGETLNDLSGEADAYAATLQSDPNTEATTVDWLETAALFMERRGECPAAVGLYRQQLTLNQAAGYDAWQGLARNALCAEAYPLASTAGWNAYRQAERDEEQVASLLVVARSLEERHSWQESWQRAALSAYQLAQQLHPEPWLAEKIELLALAVSGDRRLRIYNRYSEVGRGSTALCLDFNQPLTPIHEIHYSDYLQVTPHYKGSFEVRNQTLCYRGASFGTRYQILVRRGLSAGEYTLNQNETFTVESGHRPSAIWFEQSDYLLPRTAEATVPLHSVNVQQAALQLYRVDERNLLSPFIQKRFRSRLDGDDLTQLRDVVGELLWQQTLSLAMEERDHNLLTPLSLPAEKVAQRGLYLLAAYPEGDGVPDRWQQVATQWLLVSDLGLTSYQGRDGLTVIVRSLETARPLSAVEVTLFARNNTPLATNRTDAMGRVRFDPGLLRGEGGREAYQIIAQSEEGGMAILALQQTAFDLSDRGVGGRESPGPLDAFVYSERGVYRPGESLQLVALLRNERGEVVKDLPLMLEVMDAGEKRIEERVVRDEGGGSYQATLNLALTARTGEWRALLRAEREGPVVGELRFLVAAIAPPRMEVALSGEGVLLPNLPLPLSLQADYLFGAAAAQRPVRAGWRLEADPLPFPLYPDYHFAPLAHEAVIGSHYELERVETDAQGRAILTLELPPKISSTTPLRAKVRAEVVDVDGRAVATTTTLAVRHLARYAGIRPLFTGEVEPQSEARFQLLTLNRRGERSAGERLQWELLREESEYQWYLEDGAWHYEATLSTTTVDEGEIETDSAAAASLTLAVASGGYRLRLATLDGAILSEFRFSAGEDLSVRNEGPETLRLQLDRASYDPAWGAAAEPQLTIDSPYAGEATLVIATDRIHHLWDFQVEKGLNRQSIPLDPAWGSGAYLLVTVYRPGESFDHNGARAIGVRWVQLDPASHQLEIAIGGEDEVRSAQEVDLPLQVRGAVAGERVYLTLAAVDEGVLNLTRFTTPDPLHYFFGKRRLATRVRDLYGQLIRQRVAGGLRQGGDSGGRSAMPEDNIEILSLFSGVVVADAQGVATVPLKLPPFSGKLRLMAVAWSGDRLGSEQRSLLVRDPVVISPALPRFLALGDESELHLLLQNFSGAEGEYQLRQRLRGSITSDAPSLQRFSLQRDERKLLSIPLIAEQLGRGEIELELIDPAGVSVQRQLSLSVRGRYLPQTDRLYRQIPPQGRLQLSKDLLAGWDRAGLSLHLTLSANAGLDTAGLLQQLERYPYGCLEQLVSRALPLLYFNELAESVGVAQEENLKGRLQQAIAAIVAKQHHSGGFGLWSDRDQPQLWLSSYALEFLLRAQAAGFEVPAYAYERGLAWVAAQVHTGREERAAALPGVIYGHYLLTLAQRGEVETLRYLYDQRWAQIPTRFAQGQLA
ncbi:MAG: hypothetical protein HQL48_07580, partial [Gammaproteobacteria bacterium]|nr:hypothetical protein [Gammaproteobacteria bacterium]